MKYINYVGFVTTLFGTSISYYNGSKMAMAWLCEVLLFMLIIILNEIKELKK
jgi:hypothetical protein